MSLRTIRQRRNQSARGYGMAFLSLATSVVAVSIAVPVTIRWQSGGTMPKPMCEPFTSECLAALIQSHLPTIAFDNTTFPESRALAWMTEVDTRNQQTLSDDELVQRFAMAAIGYSIHGLDNWLTRESECSWGSGQVYCNPSGKVNRIVAQEDSLSGSIPVSIGMLTNMKVLGFFDSALTSTIPSEVKSLTALTWLWLNGNHLTGTIPSEVGGLTGLTSLDLEENKLTGTIPSEVGGLTGLSWLGLRHNALTGTIPTEVGHLKALWVLGLDNNVLTGTIPSEMGGLAALARLDLYNNTLIGTMPANVCQVALPRIDCGEIICECCQDSSDSDCP